MRVLVTGGTGFVGSHSVAALKDAGHEVRLLVRDPARIAPALAPHGLTADDITAMTGDVLDAASVEQAMADCDALLHCASMYSLDPRDAERMTRINVEGTRTVLTTAVARGLDPIVHVSSVVALTRAEPGEQQFHPDTPVGTVPFPYAASKNAQEAFARDLQAEGAPVVITYPGAVFGPHGPHDGEGVLIVRNALRGFFTLCPGGALGIVDVRDVAAVHAAVMEPGMGPRRFLAGGHALPIRDLVATIADAAGVRRPTIPIPDWMAIVTGRVADLLQRIAPWRLPFSSETVGASLNHPQIDNSATTALGVTFRPAETAIRDQVAWQRAAGRA
jgi:dihydroflavonol-4-reductase